MPNGLGVFLGSLQLSLFALYPGKAASPDPDTAKLVTTVPEAASSWENWWSSSVRCYRITWCLAVAKENIKMKMLYFYYCLHWCYIRSFVNVRHENLQFEWYSAVKEFNIIIWKQVLSFITKYLLFCLKNYILYSSFSSVRCLAYWASFLWMIVWLKCTHIETLMKCFQILMSSSCGIGSL